MSQHWHYTPAVTTVLVIEYLRRIYETRIWSERCGGKSFSNRLIHYLFLACSHQPVGFGDNVQYNAGTTAWCCRLSVIWLDLCTFCPATNGNGSATQKQQQDQHQSTKARAHGTMRTCACDACSSQSSRSYFFQRLSHFLFSLFHEGASRVLPVVEPNPYQEHTTTTARAHPAFMGCFAWGPGYRTVG